MIDWSKTTRDEMLLINSITTRMCAIEPNLKHRILDVQMDLEACHTGGCPLDLEALLAADQGDFMHDITGIHQHLNCATGQLEDCFVPRFAA